MLVSFDPQEGRGSWAHRATPRADREGKSLYDLATGLIPQGPKSDVFNTINTTTLNQSQESVQGLHEHLKDMRGILQVHTKALETLALGVKPLRTLRNDLLMT